MLLDFFNIVARSALPTFDVSRTRLPPICIIPLPVLITVSGVAVSFSRAANTTNGFTVEPGSIESVSTRLRILKLCKSERLFGL